MRRWPARISASVAAKPPSTSPGTTEGKSPPASWAFKSTAGRRFRPAGGVISRVRRLATMTPSAPMAANCFSAASSCAASFSVTTVITSAPRAAASARAPSRKGAAQGV